MTRVIRKLDRCILVSGDMKRVISISWAMQVLSAAGYELYEIGSFGTGHKLLSEMATVKILTLCCDMWISSLTIRDCRIAGLL